MYPLKELKIEVTHQCPLACIHCSSDANEKNTTHISKTKCLEIILDAIQLGVQEIAISGGEPLIWPGLEEVIATLTQHNIKSSIYTSGNAYNSDQIFTSIAKVGLGKAVFSLYSDNPLDHNRITRKHSSFNNTVSSMKLAKSLGITTEIHFVALASNYKRLEYVAQLGTSIGVDRISVLRFVPQGRGTLIEKSDTLDRTQNVELVNVILSLRQRGFDIRTGSPFNVLLLNEKPKCMAAQDRMIISPELDIFPCDAFKQITAIEVGDNTGLSNLTDNSLLDCWEKSLYFNKVRAAIQSGPNEPCSTCPQYSRCLSGCIAQRFIKFGDMYLYPDPACLRQRG